MKIEEARIGQLVCSKKNKYCIYRIVGIYGDGTIDVCVHKGLFSPPLTNYYYKRDIWDFYPYVEKFVSPPVPPPVAAPILYDVEKMLKRGTSFACFDYHGKHRHVHIGLKDLEDYPNWGEHINRAVVKHNGKKYLICKELSDNGTPKNFNIEEIENWQEK